MKTLTEENTNFTLLNNIPDAYSEDFNFKNESSYLSTNNFQLAELCCLVYQEEGEIKKQFDKWNKNNPKLNLHADIKDNHSFRFMVVSNEEFVILVFRGTVNLQNWLTDFDITQVPFVKGEGKVHQGFYQSILLMESDIDEVIRRRRTSDQKLYISGHSLGGAQATIATIQCETLSEFTSITTFGEPRIGDAEFITYVNPFLNSDPPADTSKIFRQVNQYDPVPHVPVWSYYHEAYFYIFSGAHNKRYEIEAETAPTGKGLPLETIPDEKDLINFHLNNHSMIVYLDKAKHNLKNNVFGHKTVTKV